MNNHKELPELPQYGLIATAVYELHGFANEVETVEVVENFGDSVAWQGTVHVFRLADGRTCYAWEQVRPDGPARAVVVLGEPPINSPVDAVRAAIVREFRDRLN